ncbi:hypothetical protein PP581_13155 [Mycobacteroides abscessus]|nr:hypothetical protein [Mycobacteroides abscessus]MDM2369453.1 hypothetical protein [Mycobacteroides abscessus]MDM2374937.1 hypothetical protein [Mycobacteroides abscessus]MDM2379274.1 hypothetical protein [Mycobacteroides abscessus]MDM2394954.1 hypothetical protein [Mycobacteroides abscessus]
MTEDQFNIDRPQQKLLASRLRTVADWLAESLEETITRQTAAAPRSDGGGHRRKATEETPLPYAAHAAEVRDDLRLTLRVWAAEIRPRRGEPPVPSRDVAGVARWLGEPAQIIALAMLADAEEAYDELVDAVDRAVKAVDRPRFRSFFGSCGVCATELWAFADEDEVACSVCSAVIRREDRDGRLDTILADQLLTAAELAVIAEARLGVTCSAKRVRNLGRRIPFRSVDARGRPLWNAGEMLAALAG